MLRHTSFLEIACQQVLVEDASVFSIQWSDLPAAIAGDLTSQDIFIYYLGFINKCTLTLIRPVILENGIELRLIGTKWSLLSFLPPVYADNFVTLRISGGFLVQPGRRDQGELRFGAAHLPGSVRVSLRLSEYCPSILGSGSPSLLRFWLYRMTQAAIHRLGTVRFLSQLYSRLAGQSARVRVVNVAVRDGKPV